MSPKIASLILAQIDATGLFVPDLVVKCTYKIVHSALFVQQWALCMDQKYTTSFVWAY